MSESRKILLSFFLLFALLGFGLLETERSPATSFVHKDSKFPWIHDFIFERGRMEVDIAFVGSSRTMTGVNAALIAEALGEGKQVLNFGRNWTGRELDYLVVKHLLSHHKVKHLILDTDLTSFRFKHKLARFCFTPTDHWLDLKRILSLYPLNDWALLKNDLLRDLQDLTGWVASATVRPIVNPIFLNSMRDFEKEVIRENNKTHGFLIQTGLLRAKLTDNFNWNFKSMSQMSQNGLEVSQGSQFYLKQIAALAQAHGVKVSFLYLPAVGSPLMSQQTYDFYRQWGDVLLPDAKRVFSNQEHWWDASHLFHIGATALSKDLVRLLQEGPQQAKDYGRYQPTVHDLN